MKVNLKTKFDSEEQNENIQINYDQTTNGIEKTDTQTKVQNKCKTPKKGMIPLRFNFCFNTHLGKDSASHCSSVS